MPASVWHLRWRGEGHLLTAVAQVTDSRMARQDFVMGIQLETALTRQSAFRLRRQHKTGFVGHRASSTALARQFWEPPEGEVHPAERLLVAGRPATFRRPS